MDCGLDQFLPGIYMLGPTTYRDLFACPIHLYLVLGPLLRPTGGYLLV